MKEMFIGYSLGDLNKESYIRMITTLTGRLCALPVCVLSWLKCYQLQIPGTSQLDIGKLKKEFVNISLNQSLEDSSEGSASATSPDNPKPHEERISLMANIFKKIQKSENQNEIIRADESLKKSLLTLWRKVSKQGWLDISSVLKLKEFLRIGGPKWLTTTLIQELLNEVYQEEIDKLTELTIAIFHIDLEQCTLALLLDLIPEYLTFKDKSEKLTDPHGTALAKVIVSCMYGVLMSYDKKSGAAVISSGSKRKSSVATDDYNVASLKLRRIGVDDDEIKSEPSGKSSSSSSTDDSNIMVGAVAEFLKTVQSTCLDSDIITPRMHFAVRFLEQATLRGRHKAARLIFSHMSMSLITHLIKVVPDLFSYGLITKLFDVSSSSGRKNMARILCLLKNIKSRSCSR